MTQQDILSICPEVNYVVSKLCKTSFYLVLGPPFVSMRPGVSEADGQKAADWDPCQE